MSIPVIKGIPSNPNLIPVILPPSIYFIWKEDIKFVNRLSDISDKTFLLGSYIFILWFSSKFEQLSCIPTKPRPVYCSHPNLAATLLAYIPFGHL